MLRRVLVGVVMTVCLGAGASGALAGGRTPVLGWKGAFRSGAGFSAVKPRRVYLGGDPTGDVRKLSWSRWGAPTAIGNGKGWCPGQSVAQGYVCPASLHVYKLGVCHGRRAYRMIRFYFKPRRNGPWVPGATYNACTGP